jgi:hypothetical protein
MSLKGHMRRKDRAETRGWARLYDEALRRAVASQDPREKTLRHFASNPEEACRRLSILSQVDLDREFPGETP